MNISELHRLTGGLSEPSKMPGFAYGIPAWKCILGSILAKKKGSVCNNCYALKGMYVFPVVKAAQERRLKSIGRPDWVALMTELIGKKYRKTKGSDRVFRWHDSGDLQSTQHLSKLVEIANNLLDIRFWLPTRERGIIFAWLGDNQKGFPTNLVVRISMQMVGQESPTDKGKEYPTERIAHSTVGAKKGFQCPASTQGNECKNCRACWDLEVSSVNYHEH